MLGSFWGLFYASVNHMGLEGVPINQNDCWNAAFNLQSLISRTSHFSHQSCAWQTIHQCTYNIPRHFSYSLHQTQNFFWCDVWMLPTLGWVWQMNCGFIKTSLCIEVLTNLPFAICQTRPRVRSIRTSLKKCLCLMEWIETNVMYNIFNLFKNY